MHIIRNVFSVTLPATMVFIAVMSIAPIENFSGGFPPFPTGSLGYCTAHHCSY
jgi:hypothetical protein